MPNILWKIVILFELTAKSKANDEGNILLCLISLYRSVLAMSTWHV